MEPVARRPAVAPRARRGRARGFTLIEMMVVVVIAAVLSSMLVLAAMPDDASRAHEEARRLAALLELASAESRASGQSLAWSPERGGYSFWQRGEDDEWARFPETSIYRQRSFSGQTAFRAVFVDARELPAGERIAFPPYGSHPLIEATIAGGNARFTLRGGVLGRISLQRDAHDSRSGADARLHAG